MADNTMNSYSQQKERLEEIVIQIRAKDLPLEKSLDLYDEALAIGTRCVERLEQTDFTAEELDSVLESSVGEAGVDAPVGEGVDASSGGEAALVGEQGENAPTGDAAMGAPAGEPDGEAPTGAADSGHPVEEIGNTTVL